MQTSTTVLDILTILDYLSLESTFVLQLVFTQMDYYNNYCVLQCLRQVLYILRYRYLSLLHRSICKNFTLNN